MHCKTAARLGLLVAVTVLGLLSAGAAGAGVASKVEGESLLAADPANAQAYQDFAAFYFGLGNPAAAADVLERGKVRADVTAGLLVDLGRAYQLQKQWNKAENATREALVLDAGHAGAHVQLGEIYLAMGWARSGLDCFRQAVALAPGDPLPKVRLVRGLCDNGQVAEAEETCLQFIAEGAEHADLWLALGQVFEKQGKHREAFTTYGQALTLDPASSTAWARQGKLFCEFGQFDAAAQSCRRALELNPDDALAHGYLGIALSHLGDGEGARQHAQIAEAAGLNMTAVWRALER